MAPGMYLHTLIPRKGGREVTTVPELKLIVLGSACRLPNLANYLIKAERELWGLLEGPWAGVDGNAYRRSWGQQVLPLHVDGLLLQIPGIDARHT